MENILEIINLSTHFHTDSGLMPSVDRVSLCMERGTVMGLVGESGCGKTVLSLSVMGMVPYPGRVAGGKILYQRQDLLTLTEEEMRRVRGSRIGMIFQDPLTSLNPVFSIREQLTRPLMIHKGLSAGQAEAEAVRILEKVGIPAPARRICDYPHQFSGGQRQRIMIAAALSLGPDVIIADEPTTALDVSIQAQILQLLRDLQKETGMSLLIISHNLGVISGMAHRVAAMYGGWVVEEAPADTLFASPLHPYTQALIQAVPTIWGEKKPLKSLPGHPPSAGEILPGCRLHPRCPRKMPGLCDTGEPPLVEASPGHRVKCFLYSRAPDGKR